jgi:hypothetical protein
MRCRYPLGERPDLKADGVTEEILNALVRFEDLR